MIGGYYIIQSERKYIPVSLNDALHLIKDCKVSKAYGIGSNSHRSPGGLRTVLELKDGRVMKTERNTPISVFEETIDDANCPSL